MAVKPILTKKHAVLRTKATPVEANDTEINEIVKDLVDTLASTADFGIGLAANQIGHTKQVFAAKLGGVEDISVFINPKIISKSTDTTVLQDKQREHLEGCLSLPHIYSFVERSFKIIVEYHTPESLQKNNPYSETFTGDDSILIQHEIDHLNGILFTDHALAQSQKLYEIRGENEAKEIEL